MKKKYFKRSRLSNKTIRKLARFFIGGEKISLAARDLNLEQKTVRDKFLKFRRCLEEDCHHRLKTTQIGIEKSLYPLKVLNPGLRAKNDYSGGNRVYPPGIVVVIYCDGTVTTNCILTPLHAQIEHNYLIALAVNEEEEDEEEEIYEEIYEEDEDQKALRIQQEKAFNEEFKIFTDSGYGDFNYYVKNSGDKILGYFYADLWFRPIVGYINDEFESREYSDDRVRLSKNPYRKHMKSFLRYAQLRSSKVQRTNLRTFYLFLKEVEWLYNNTVLELLKLDKAEAFLLSLSNSEISKKKLMKNLKPK